MTKVDEQARLLEITRIEQEYWAKGETIGGLDEVGRGPLAGPVVVACAIMPPEPLIKYVNDSKKVSERRREFLYPQLTETAIAYNIAFISHETIDAINILDATRLGFKNAFEGMSVVPDHVVCDYISGLNINADYIPLVHGDAISYTIGAASIIAKVARDRYMQEQDALYPQYGFARNKGYGTAEHIAALCQYGPCPIHRQSFVATVLEKAKNTVVSGREGELITEKYLKDLGFETVCKNFSANHGEIDIIMRDAQTIVFVEVKARSSCSFSTGLAAITPAKQKKLIECAKLYCRKECLYDTPMRFDAVEVDLSSGTVKNYVRGAFTE